LEEQLAEGERLANLIRTNLGRLENAE
jgi:hypothetical protein